MKRFDVLNVRWRGGSALNPAHARNQGTYAEDMTWEAMADALQAAFPTPPLG